MAQQIRLTFGNAPRLLFSAVFVLKVEKWFVQNRGETCNVLLDGFIWGRQPWVSGTFQVSCCVSLRFIQTIQMFDFNNPYFPICFNSLRFYVMLLAMPEHLRLELRGFVGRTCRVAATAWYPLWEYMGVKSLSAISFLTSCLGLSRETSSLGTPFSSSQLQLDAMNYPELQGAGLVDFVKIWFADNSASLAHVSNGALPSPHPGMMTDRDIHWKEKLGAGWEWAGQQRYVGGDRMITAEHRLQ